MARHTARRRVPIDRVETLLLSDKDVDSSFVRPPRYSGDAVRRVAAAR
jgi:hypothetical protein